jgi:hypothetical protein
LQHFSLCKNRFYSSHKTKFAHIMFASRTLTHVFLSLILQR